MKELEFYSFDGVDKSLQHNAKNTIGRMRRDAPVDSGRLRRNIDYKSGFHDVNFFSEAIDPDDNKDYAPSQEFGTRYFGATPYFFKNVRRFLDDTRKDINRRIKNILNKTR